MKFQGHTITDLHRLIGIDSKPADDIHLPSVFGLSPDRWDEIEARLLANAEGCIRKMPNGEFDFDFGKLLTASDVDALTPNEVFAAGFLMSALYKQAETMSEPPTRKILVRVEPGNAPRMPRPSDN